MTHILRTPTGTVSHAEKHDSVSLGLLERRNAIRCAAAAHVRVRRRCADAGRRAELADVAVLGATRAPMISSADACAHALTSP